MSSNPAPLSVLSGFNAFKLTKAARREMLKQLILASKTRLEIARACGVTERTLRRDFRAWFEEGGFDEWCLAEFIELHRQVKAEDPLAAYHEICLLMAKTIKMHIEAEVRGPSPIIVRMYDPLQDPERPAAEAAAAERKSYQCRGGL